MSHTRDTAKINEHLDSLARALHQQEAKNALALLRVLRMNGLEDATSAVLVAAFTEGPVEGDFHLALEWVEDQKAILAAPDEPAEILSTFDEFNPFDDLDFVSFADEISDIGAVESLDDFLSFAEEDELPVLDDDDAMARVDQAFAALSEVSENETTGSSSGELSIEDLFGSDEPYEPTDIPIPESPDELALNFDFDLDDSKFEADSSPPPLSPASTLTGDRERTRQFDPAQLQALSSASSAQDDQGDQDDQDDEGFFDPESPFLKPEVPTKVTAQPESEATGDVYQEPTRTGFRAPGFDDDLDFDLKPHTFDSGEHLDFDLGPDPSSEDDFDFDLGPYAAADHATSDEDFELGLSAPSTGSGSPPLADDPFAASMGYADPVDDDFFFPPPLNAAAAASTHQPSAIDPASTEASHLSPPTRLRQDTPVLRSPDASSLSRSQQATPARGSTPIPSSMQSPQTVKALPTMNDRALNEEEMLALGEGLSQSGSTAAGIDRGDSEFSEASDSQPRYRGEPMIREVGDEPTPNQDAVVEQSLDSFSRTGDVDPTNPFAQQAPTGVRSDHLGPAEASSFVLEEVNRPPSGPADPAAAIARTLDRARALYETAAFEEARDLVDAVLDVDPDSEKAKDLRDLLEGEFERIQKKRIGALARTPTLAVSMGEIAGLDLDNRAGFLISQIDGMLTFEDILDMSAMSRLETLTLLADLLERKIIAVE